MVRVGAVINSNILQSACDGVRGRGLGVVIDRPVHEHDGTRPPSSGSAPVGMVRSDHAGQSIRSVEIKLSWGDSPHNA